MVLKSTELTRAEYLTEEDKKLLGAQEGLVIVETTNPILNTNKKLIAGGYTAYLRSLGKYKEDPNWKVE